MFEFDTEEELEIRKEVRKLAQKEIPPYENEEFHGTVPKELFEKLAELGLTGLSIEEQFGGIAATASTTALVIEELARVNLGPAVFLSVHCMVSGLIQRFGNDTQKQKYLPQMASGEMLGAFALSESSAGSDAASLRTKAVKSDSGYTLNGSKCWITSAGFADVYVVFAKSTEEGGKDGISAFIIEPGGEGFSIGSPEKKMGCELSPIATLEFSDHQVPKESLLGELHKGYRVALSGLAGGRVNIAACAVGLADSALEKSVKQLIEREQFGKPLIEMQGLQFMLADMKMKLEASRMLNWRASRQLSLDPSNRNNRLFPSISKCFCTDSAMSIATDAVQLFGAAGYMQEYGIERLMRDAKALQIVEGANQVQRMVIARELQRASQ